MLWWALIAELLEKPTESEMSPVTSHMKFWGFLGMQVSPKKSYIPFLISKEEILLMRKGIAPIMGHIQTQYLCVKSYIPIPLSHLILVMSCFAFLSFSFIACFSLCRFVCIFTGREEWKDCWIEKLSILVVSISLGKAWFILCPPFIKL